MEKIEYSDLNKFLVSVGVALIGVSILIVWLFFREPFDLLVEQKTIKNLTHTAQAIIYARQYQVSQLLRFIPFISLMLFLFGSISLFIGLVRWLKKQKMLDERDELTNQKLQKELEKLSETEVVKKAEIEFMQTIGEQIPPTQISADPFEKQQFINSYLEAEQAIFYKLKTYFSDKYNVLTNYRLKQFEYDIILETPNNFDIDKIIEIKYSPNELTAQYIRETLIRFGIAIQYYKETMQKPVTPILILVIPKVKYTNYNVDSLKEAFKQLQSLKVENLSLHFIAQNELHDLTKERLAKIIGAE